MPFVGLHAKGRHVPVSLCMPCLQTRGLQSLSCCCMPCHATLLQGERSSAPCAPHYCLPHQLQCHLFEACPVPSIPDFPLIALVGCEVQAWLQRQIGLTHADARRYIPFSGGPRKCVGDQFALMEAVVSLAVVLKSYSFAMVPGHDPGMTTGATIHTQNGMYMHVSRRSGGQSNHGNGKAQLPRPEAAVA